jgi:hypothetical protein
MRNVVIVLALVAGAGALFWATQERDAQPVQADRDSPAAPMSPGAEATNEALPPAAATPGIPALTEDEQRARFHERVRTFFANAPALSIEEKQKEARELDPLIEVYESRRELSAAEALTLRLALIRETTPEAEQLERMKALRDQYRARDAQRSAQTSDPMFELYKAREQEIVTQVQAMGEFPGGQTREEYLRERLQREREMLLEETGDW